MLRRCGRDKTKGVSTSYAAERAASHKPIIAVDEHVADGNASSHKLLRQFQAGQNCKEMAA